MRILDRYIARKFLFTLGFSLIAFISIFVIVDLIENLDKFMDRKVPENIIAMYYVYYLPFIVVLTMPVSVLLSTLFSIGTLARNFELTAMKANGISLYRIIIPLYVIGIFISLFFIVAGDEVVSISNRRRSDLKAQYIDKRPRNIKTITTDLFVEGEQGRMYYIKQYNASIMLGTGILVHRIENNRVKETIEAEEMRYSEKGWVALNGIRRVFSEDSLTPDTFEKFDRLLLKGFNEPPEAFEKVKANPEDMTYSELRDYIALKRKLGKDTARERVELNLKISFPLINFIIIVLGAPLASNPRRSGVALGFAISVLISFIYFTIIRACQSLGQNHNLQPMLAAWLGNIIFIAVGIVLTLKAHK